MLNSVVTAAEAHESSQLYRLRLVDYISTYDPAKRHRRSHPLISPRLDHLLDTLHWHKALHPRKWIVRGGSAWLSNAHELCGSASDIDVQRGIVRGVRAGGEGRIGGGFTKFWCLSSAGGLAI